MRREMLIMVAVLAPASAGDMHDRTMGEHRCGLVNGVGDGLATEGERRMRHVDEVG